MAADTIYSDFGAQKIKSDTVSTVSPSISKPSKPGLVAQLVKNPPAVRKTWVWFLGWEDPLEKGTATHSSILSWKIPWTSPWGHKESDMTEQLSVRHLTTKKQRYIKQKSEEMYNHRHINISLRIFYQVQKNKNRSILNDVINKLNIIDLHLY